MMHLYSTFLCIAVHPKRFTIMWGGGVSPQPPPVCSIHLDDATAATGQRQPVRSPHTSYRWRGKRDRANQVDGDYWEAMIDKGQWREFGQDTGTLGLTSHPKDGAFCQYSVPIIILGH